MDDAFNPASALGLAAFDALSAEDEPWLASCYVPPAEFSLMAGARSALIYGESGSGKTALRYALERTWRQSEQAGSWLAVEWPLNALVGAAQNPAGSPLAALQQAQVYDVVARALLRFLGQRPGLWQNAPDWARTTLVWFIRRSFLGDAATYIASLAADPALADPTALHTILAAEPTDLLSPDSPPTFVVRQLTEGLNRLGVPGIRILVDNVEPWWEVAPERLGDGLYAFLSILALFEHPGFVYKMLLPAGLSPRLNQATGVVRRRVQTFRLDLSEAELVAVLERRVATALGRPRFALQELGPAVQLRDWLAGCGGSSPRGWLETGRAFVAAYLACRQRTGSSQPLTAEECRDVQQRHPPHVWIDQANCTVIVGWRRVEGLGPGHLGVLRYLLDHPGQLCSRKQLYKAYIESYPGEHADSEARPVEYAGVLDSALWRLRERIEPIPNGPQVLVETRKGQGVVLRTL
jgi:DNA-binding winged helix-turn-helix (wHTH) protein